MKSQKPYGHKLRRALMLCIFTLFSLGALLSTYVLATYLPRRNGDSLEIVIPSLEGTRLTDNDERLPEDLYEIVYDYRADAASEPGTVLIQKPAPRAKRRVIPGHSPCVIRLTVSTGAAEYTLPPMIGKSAREMQLQLQAQGLTVRLKQKTRNDLSSGQVIAIEPPEGTVVREGEVVTITESTVTTHKVVRVPTVLGSDLSTANNALVLRGLRPDTPEYEYSATVPQGAIISQRPLAGTLVPAGSPAHLVVSLGGAQEEEQILEGEE